MKVVLSTLSLLIASQIVLSAGDVPKYQSSTGHSYCFKSRDMMYPLDETFDALKQTLMQSNLNIATVTKNDGVLTAKGNQYNADEDTIIGITLTVDFKEREKGTTSIKVIASYETVEKKSDTGQIGGAGITLPIPVPFTGKYTVVGQGNIDDSTWYRGFFSSLEKILFENHMKYSHIKKEVEPILVKIEETPKEVELAPVVEAEKSISQTQEQTSQTTPVEEVKAATTTAEVEQPTQVTTEVKTETQIEPITPNNPQ